MKIDFHSHTLFGVDHGALNIGTSLLILRELKKCGFSHVICTPHYYQDSHVDNKIVQKNFLSLKKALLEDGNDINLSLGNEIHYFDSIISFAKTKKINVINNKTVLIELSFSDDFHALAKNILNISHTYNVVIAHPERYVCFQKDNNFLFEFFKHGIRYQLDYDSLIGYFGNEAQRLAEYLLKNNLVSAFGTDVHEYSPDYKEYFDLSEHKIINMIGEKRYQDIMKESGKLCGFSK